jgi:hypothetical protein
MSLLPLGILASSGGFNPGAFEQIATAFGTGSSGVIDFTSIPSTYKHLQIRYTAKGNTSSIANMNVTFNNVTSSNYARHQVAGTSNTISIGTATSASNISLLNAITSNSLANAATAGIIDILDYANSSTNKSLRAIYGIAEGGSGSSFTYQASGFLNSTTAISRITLTASAHHFANISRFSLYGIKG